MHELRFLGGGKEAVDYREGFTCARSDISLFRGVTGLELTVGRGMFCWDTHFSSSFCLCFF